MSNDKKTYTVSDTLQGDRWEVEATSLQNALDEAEYQTVRDGHAHPGVERTCTVTVRDEDTNETLSTFVDIGRS